MRSEYLISFIDEGDALKLDSLIHNDLIEASSSIDVKDDNYQQYINLCIGDTWFELVTVKKGNRLVQRSLYAEDNNDRIVIYNISAHVNTTSIKGVVNYKYSFYLSLEDPSYLTFLDLLSDETKTYLSKFHYEYRSNIKDMFSNNSKVFGIIKDYKFSYVPQQDITRILPSEYDKIIIENTYSCIGMHVSKIMASLHSKGYGKPYLNFDKNEKLLELQSFNSFEKGVIINLYPQYNKMTIYITDNDSRCSINVYGNMLFISEAGNMESILPILELLLPDVFDIYLEKDEFINILTTEGYTSSILK